MKILRGVGLAGALTALGFLTATAQTVEFRATINAAQETTASASAATGWAVMVYDVTTNTFDLTVTINDLTNTLTASHVHEGALGVAGGVVTNLGAEAVYTRSGNTLTATFSGVTHGGTPLTLLQNGAYVNFHSAAYPGGEVRGQLIAQPKRLTAVLKGSSEVPARDTAAFGAAYVSYNAGTNKVTTRLQIYHFTNTLSASHYHEAAAGVNGPVVHNLGGASVYTKTGNSYAVVFTEQTYSGDPVKLLSGGAYLNVHSNVYAGGEIRGQVWPSDELEVSRLVNVSARGWVGLGDQVLISGFVITGTEPVRVLVKASGPSLTALGVAGALANPMLTVYDSAGRALVANDDHATGFSSANLAATGFAPTQANDSALLLVLPPGNYSTVVSGVGATTGVALVEVYEVRAARSGTSNLAQAEPVYGPRRLRVKPLRMETAPATVPPALEFCVAPLTTPALATVSR